VPWHVASSSSCPAAKPFAVIKTSDGSVAGCHPTREAANAQLAALYASENGIGHQSSGSAVGQAVPWQDPAVAYTTPMTQVW
jgi:hypothetical protein